MTAKAAHEYLVKLRHILEESFNESELRTLCFDLHIDYESLLGQSKADKARELVAYFGRRNNITELGRAVREKRPSVGLEKPPQPPRRRAFIGLAAFTALLGLLIGALGYRILWCRDAPRLAAIPGNLVEHFDFGTSASGWEEMRVSDDDWDLIEVVDRAAILPSGPGEQGLAYELEIQAGKERHYAIRYTRPVQADVILARFYLPDTPDIVDNIVWVTAKDKYDAPSIVYSLSSIPLGEWTQIVLDVRGVNDSDGKPLNERPFYVGVVYTIEANTNLQSDTLLARLDDVALYTDVGNRVVE